MLLYVFPLNFFKLFRRIKEVKNFFTIKIYFPGYFLTGSPIFTKRSCLFYPCHLPFCNDCNLIISIMKLFQSKCNRIVLKIVHRNRFHHSLRASPRNRRQWPSWLEPKPIHLLPFRKLVRQLRLSSLSTEDRTRLRYSRRWVSKLSG